jgi:hypothetical protein
MQKKRDIGFILSLGLIIAIGSYWFVKEMPVEGIEFYSELLGDKLMALVPKAEEQSEFAEKIDEFKNQIREKKIAPEKVEQMAATLINLDNANDTLSVEEAEALIQIAVVAEPVDKAELILAEPSPEVWDKLNKRLGIVYEFNEKIKEHELKLPDEEPLSFQVDDDLNVIIDSRVRPALENEEILLQMEKENQVVWMDNLKEELEQIDIQLKKVEKGYIKKEQQVRIKILAQQAMVNALASIDSLSYVTDIIRDSIRNAVIYDIAREKARIPRPDHREKRAKIKKETP